MIDYVPPEFQKDAFHCPYCGAYAHQSWVYLGYTYKSPGVTAPIVRLNFAFASQCRRCEAFSFWLDDKNMIYPSLSTAPLAAEDLPNAIKSIYNEARDILNRSPRGSAALLRLALQLLSVHLGQKGKNLDNDIGELVKAGLPEDVQRALDIVRVIGNNAVHPGVIDLEDTPEIANRLFELINFIVEKMITEPKKIKELYEALPDGAKDHIKDRNGNTS